MRRVLLVVLVLTATSLGLSSAEETKRIDFYLYSHCRGRPHSLTLSGLCEEVPKGMFGKGRRPSQVSFASLPSNATLHFYSAAGCQYKTFRTRISALSDPEESTDTRKCWKLEEVVQGNYAVQSMKLIYK